MLWGQQAPPTLGGVSVFGTAGIVLAVRLAFRLLLAFAKDVRIERQMDRETYR